jgi:hypothetical protein
MNMVEGLMRWVEVAVAVAVAVAIVGDVRGLGLFELSLSGGGVLWMVGASWERHGLKICTSTQFKLTMSS